MVEGDAPGLGEREPPPLAQEEIMPERRLEGAQLRRERRLREVQPARGAGQRAVMGDGAEETQVMQVQDGHTSIKQNRTVQTI